MTPRRLALVLLVLIAIPIVWTWWGSERRRIERQVGRLEELVSKAGKESALEGAATARAVSDLFASSFQVRAQQLGFSTRDRQELIRFIYGYRSSSDSIDMRVRRSSLSITPEHRRATQNASFDFLTGGPLSSSSESYRVQVNWLREEGEWRIDYVDLIEIVDRSSGPLGA